MNYILPTIISILALLVSVSLHEAAHAYAAKIGGDDTAERAGRLTLNPLRHIDLVGSIIVPALLILSGVGVVIGWAKPVPINYHNLGGRKINIIRVALAGVLTNFALAITAGLIWSYLLPYLPSILITYLDPFLRAMVFLNLILGFFNLIPLPPLDGSRVVSTLLSSEQAEVYRRIEPFGIFIIFALLYFGAFKYLLQIISPLYFLLINR